MFGWWDVDHPDEYVVVARRLATSRAALRRFTRLELDTIRYPDALWAQTRANLMADVEAARG